MFKDITKQIKNGNYRYVYEQLNALNYDYTLDNITRDFKSVQPKDMYCYLIYLLSVDNVIKNYILLCEWLMYCETIFYDVNSVINMFLRQALHYHDNNLLYEWIVETYGDNPDSPFSDEEIRLLKSKIT